MTGRATQYSTPAIILGTHTMGLGVIRALGENGVPVVAVHYDQRDTGYYSKYVKESVPAPHPGREEQAFLNVLIDLAARYSGAVLFPVSDATLVPVSRNKRLLERYYRVACAEWDIVSQLIDKKYTYAVAEAVGVPAPKTMIPQCTEDVERYAQMVDFPCLIKPCKSHEYNAKFHKKMVWASSLDELVAAYQEASDAGLEVMLQEYIPGEDSQGVNYNSYSIDGKPIIEFTAQKVRSSPPVIGSPCVAYSKHIEGVIGPGRKILEAFGYYGFACTEFKLDPRDGVYKLMEINGRHNLSSLLAVHCGLNFPLIHYCHILGYELPSSYEYSDGIYWVDLNRDLAYLVKRTLKSPGTLLHFFEPYFKPHVQAVLDWKDPKPYFKQLAILGSRAFSSSRLHPQRAK